MHTSLLQILWIVCWRRFLLHWISTVGIFDRFCCLWSNSSEDQHWKSLVTWFVCPLLTNSKMDVYGAQQSFALLLLVIWYTAQQQCPLCMHVLEVGVLGFLSLSPLEVGWIDVDVNLWIRFTLKALLTPCCIYGSDRP